MRPFVLAVAATATLLACDTVFDVPDQGGAVGRTAVVVRVATWNVHDLFDDIDRPIPPGDLDTVLSAAEVDAKLTALAAVLLRVDADVVLLQEVENRAILGRLAALAGYPDARLVEGSDPRGIDVAALSRLPIDAYVSHLGETDASGRPLWPRDCVEVHVRVGGRALVVVGSHFSSALSDDGPRRTAQAARLREIADAVRTALPGTLVVAGGDLNDRPESVPLEPLLGDGAWLDEAPAATPTWIGASGSARFDYLLVPREDRGALAAAQIVVGGDVAAASDHRPVVVDLRVR
jgi:endonuclease/exonuclease/phosphatase family metal-dependent hydrolase